ncbi:MAG: chorismate synthase [Bacteroidales bacterium]|nr:chorismate synthase [Bacteroidales bacterium]
MDLFGQHFRLELFGASHAPFIGVTLRDVPATLPLSPDDFTTDLLRRKSGAPGTTTRIEDDLPQIEDRRDTDGTLTIRFANRNYRDEDYKDFTDIPRPGHADFVAMARYGSLRDGWFSGRMTLPLVAAGVVAKRLIAPTLVEAQLTEVGGVAAAETEAVAQALEAAAREGDSLGGIVECRCTGVPVGLGEPFFDSLESLLSHAIFSIPGIRGIEFGDGFAAARMTGSTHNDPFIDAEGHTARNGAGGINGGLSNGNPVVFRVAVKPTSSIRKPQRTFDFAHGCLTDYSVPGRHDVCFALRVPPVVEAVTACVFANLIL